jgi:hypothetical protein
VVGRHGLAGFLGMLGSAALGGGLLAVAGATLARDLDVDPGLLRVEGIVLLVGVVLVALALVTSPASVRERIIGGALAGGGILAATALYFSSGLLGWRFVLALAVLLVVGLAVSGLLIGLGALGPVFLSLPLIAIPAVVVAFIPSWEMLFLVQLGTAFLALAIVGVGSLSASWAHRRRSGREAVPGSHSPAR